MNTPPRTGDVDTRPEVQSLFESLKASMPELEKLLEACSDHWGYEDGVYRFYHQSFKVYAVHRATSGIVTALQALAPERELNDWFVQIVKDGTGKTFEQEHNRRWLEVTRPIIEAFFHARYFLEMAVRYGKELEGPTVRAPERVGSVPLPIQAQVIERMPLAPLGPSRNVAVSPPPRAARRGASHVLCMVVRVPRAREHGLEGTARRTAQPAAARGEAPTLKSSGPPQKVFDGIQLRARDPRWRHPTASVERAREAAPARDPRRSIRAGPRVMGSRASVSRHR